MRFDQFLCILSGVNISLAFPTLSLWTREIGSPPPELLADIARVDEHSGSEAKRNTVFPAGRAIGPPPVELLADIARLDEDFGSETKRDTKARMDVFENLPDELQEDSHVLEKRDSRHNCGEPRDGNVMTWVAVATWIEAAELFCAGQTGPDRMIPIADDCDGKPCADGTGYLWQAINVNLTPRNGNPEGDPGHINFYMRNTVQKPAGSLSYADCVTYQKKQSNGPDVGKSACWGSQNNDTKGGTWKVDSFGLVGGYIKSGHVATPFD